MSKYDFLILGAGGTGLASAMYAARLGLKTIVLGASHETELPIGGVITTTDIVENYPGFSKISGFELAKKFEEQARGYKNVTIKEEKALEIRKAKNYFSVKTEKGSYDSKTILFATGAKWRKLEIPGSDKFERKGISYCALCDAPLFRDRIVAVIGGGDSAAKEAILIASYAKKVYVIARSTFHPEEANLKKIRNNKKIEIIEGTNVTGFTGDDILKAVSLDKSHKGKKQISLDGVFIAIGHIPLSGLAKEVGVKINDKEEIEINHETSETNVPGIFAAGDVTNKGFKQLITGVADGCTAAYSANEFLNK
jgi:thioredoxin-disulfide reductase